MTPSTHLAEAPRGPGSCFCRSIVDLLIIYRSVNCLWVVAKGASDVDGSLARDFGVACAFVRMRVKVNAACCLPGYVRELCAFFVYVCLLCFGPLLSNDYVRSQCLFAVGGTCTSPNA